MLSYTVRRILGSVPTLFGILALTFFLLRLAPGGPFDTDRAWPHEIQKNIERKYGLDKPLHVQFATWFGDLMTGDLRDSFQYGYPVAGIIEETLPVSAALGAWALVLAIAAGIPLGAVSAWKHRSWMDFSATFIAISGISLPSYLVASILVLLFSVWLDWLPPALMEGPESLILPVFTLALRPMAMIARLTRASMIDAGRADYVRTARAKGASEARVVFKHVLRNSLIPVMALFGPLVAGLITGSFVVEVIFQLPGMGKHFVAAVLNRDYPLVMGVTLVYGALLLVSNLAVDLAYAWADPRIRLR